MDKPILSVAIPTHQMEDWEYFLKRCLDSLWNQTFQDFEIVITDNSEDDSIKNMCDWYHTGINYFRNPKKGIAPNTNESIRKSKGEFIKILYMDDYLLHDEVLEKVIEKCKTWLICGSDNNFDPRWTDDVIIGNNKLGSPSALTIKNDNPPLFDENLSWLLDVVYYKELYSRYGEPKIMNGKHIGIGIGDHQLTHLIGDEEKLKEYEYVIKKYG